MRLALDSKDRTGLAVLGAILFFAALFFFWPRPQTNVKLFDPAGSVAPYVKEFKKPDWRKSPTVAPNGTARIVDSEEGKLFTSCHTLSLVYPDGRKKRVLALREADPGSGLSFSWGWSADSNAFIVYGSNSDGIDCGKIPVALPLIYTLADDTVWSVPNF